MARDSGPVTVASGDAEAAVRAPVDALMDYSETVAAVSLAT
jgi:hypothetical protein